MLRSAGVWPEAVSDHPITTSAQMMALIGRAMAERGRLTAPRDMFALRTVGRARGAMVLARRNCDGKWTSRSFEQGLESMREPPFDRQTDR